jgi:hypothetical protein
MKLFYHDPQEQGSALPDGSPEGTERERGSNQGSPRDSEAVTGVEIDKPRLSGVAEWRGVSVSVIDKSHGSSVPTMVLCE